tara:strand:+ start:181 stop:2652 length:2472 start_codon:yes stop_codon:yes gene_type:complete
MIKKNIMKKIIPHFIAVGIFIAISAIYFYPIFEGKILSAHDVDTWKGMSKEVQDFRNETGEEALWTKRMFSGMPAYQISTQSNGNLIQYVDKVFKLGLPKPMHLLFMYLIGFYILLLTLKIDYKLAILGAIGFAFSSYFIIIIQAGHMTKANAIAYLPLIIASVLYTFRSEKWLLGATFTSLFVALQLYSNHYQITYYTIIILFFIGIVQFIHELRSRNLSNFFKKVGILLIAALLGGATNYTRLSTTMEYGPETQRGKSELVTEDGKVQNDGLGLTYATRWSYGISETMTFLIPNFMGGSTGPSVLFDSEGKIDKDSKTYNYLATVKNNNKRKKLQQQTSSYWGEQPGTSPTYVGAIIMFLFVLGILYVNSSYKYWILISTILAIMLAWGHNFMSLTEFFFNYIPAYNKFRAVTMAMIIAEFGIALLAILSLNKLFTAEDNTEKERKLKLAFYIVAGITLLFAIVPSVFLDFLSSNDYLNDNYKFKSSLASDRASLLKSDAWRSFIFILLSFVLLWIFVKGKIKRIFVIFILGFLILVDMWSVDKRYLNETHFVEETTNTFRKTKVNRDILKLQKQNKDFHSRVFNLNNPFNESTTSYYHNSIGGYHAAKLLRYQELIDNQLSKEHQKIITDLQNQKAPKFSPVLNMLNTKYIIYNPKAAPIINQDALGNAWFVSDVKTVENANLEMESLDAFNPAKTAIIDDRFEDKIKIFNLDPSAEIKLIQKEYKPNHLTYSLKNITSDHLAVFSEIFYEKGWNAYIDGEKVPHFRANYVLRAMMVPKGTTKIEFKFKPSSYSTGESVAYASSIILLLLLGFVCYKELK